MPTAKAYVVFVAGCLDRVWTKHLAKAGITFKKPKLSLVGKDPHAYCGLKWEKNRIFDYCERDRAILIVLDRKLLSKKPDDLYIFTLVATLYGHHVQNLTGIERAFVQAVQGHDDEAVAGLARRLYLQHFCLAGAFTGSVYRSMPRNAADWRFVVRIKGREADRYRGTAKSIANWMNRGFTTRDPKNCNTWTASNSLVA